MQRRTASRAEASSSKTSRSPSPPQDKQEEAYVIYSCAPKVAFTLDTNRLTTLVGRYQIPSEFRPRLPERGEWCCSPLSGFGVYTSYPLAGLRFPLNSFCKGLFHRLGIGQNQLNPNRWRTIVAMQVLWREVFEGNRPIIVNEFLYCYKPSEITQFASFYQFLSRGSQFSLIRGHSSSDRLWKKEFFFISRNWVGDLIDVNNAPFPPFTSALGCLRPEDMFFFLCFVCFIWSFPRLTLFCVCVAITRPHLGKFHLDRIDRTRAYPNKSFHNLVTLRHLAIWGLGPEPTNENHAHEETTRRSKYRPFIHHHFFLYIINSMSSPLQG